MQAVAPDHPLGPHADVVREQPLDPAPCWWRLPLLLVAGLDMETFVLVTATAFGATYLSTGLVYRLEGGVPR